MRGEKLELALVGFTAGGFVLTVVVVLLLVTRLPLLQRGGPAPAAATVQVRVGPDGALSVEGAAVDARSLGPALGTALRSRPGVPVTIEVADGAPAARVELVARAVEAVRRAPASSTGALEGGADAAARTAPGAPAERPSGAGPTAAPTGAGRPAGPVAPPPDAGPSSAATP